jgi:hypothetical protein
MDSPEYKEIFQTRLKEDSQAAGKWETQQGGEYYAAVLVLQLLGGEPIL